jgi:ankyrin repeat protein
MTHRIGATVLITLFSLSVPTAAQEIIEAARRGDVAAVTQLLARDSTLVRSVDERECTPLHFAADNGNVELVELLLERGAALEARDVDGDTPLFWAAHAGNAEVFEVLIAGGADPNASNTRHQTLLHYAARGGSAAVIEMVLARPVDINARDRDNGVPLHRAVLWNHREATRRLIAAGADLEARDAYERTPLLLVARETGSAEMAALLVDAGADINPVDRFGDTPLSLAAWRGFGGVIDVLLDNGADVPTAGPQATQLTRFAADYGLVRLFGILEEAGVDLTIRNDNGGTLLHSASAGGSRDLAESMLERGFDVNEADRYGWAPLHHAADKGRSDVVELLVGRGADINARTMSGNTPLNIAQASNRDETTRLLLENGAVPDPQAFPSLNGPYFAQVAPDMEPVLFAPDIVSSNRFMHGTVTFSPDGWEAFWPTSVPRDSGYTLGRIVTARLTNGRWTPPEPSPFAGVLGQGNDIPFFSHDGAKLYFLSGRPDAGGQSGGERIWFTERADAGWSEPTLIDGGPNSLELHWQFSVAANGNIYVGSRGDISVSRLVDGEYATPERLGDVVNSEYDESSPYIAPDESYLIFDRLGAPDGVGSADLYISFRRSDDSWTAPVNMGEPMNSPAHDRCPIVTYDGRYLFFTSHRNGNSDNYWVDARIIEGFRPPELR